MILRSEFFSPWLIFAIRRSTKWVLSSWEASEFTLESRSCPQRRNSLNAAKLLENQPNGSFDARPIWAGWFKVFTWSILPCRSSDSSRLMQQSVQPENQVYCLVEFLRRVWNCLGDICYLIRKKTRVCVCDCFLNLLCVRNINVYISWSVFVGWQLECVVENLTVCLCHMQPGCLSTNRGANNVQQNWMAKSNVGDGGINEGITAEKSNLPSFLVILRGAF